MYNRLCLSHYHARFVVKFTRDLTEETRGPMGLYRSPGSLGLMVDQKGKFGSNQLSSFIRIDFQKSGKKYV